MSERLIVIGGVAAGMSAAAKAKRTDRSLNVVVYERGPYISYAACGMPYFIAGDISALEDLIERTPERMAQQGVDVHIYHEVTAIDPETQTVTIHDLQTGRRFVQSYDKLVIATGARAAPSSLPGSDLEGIFSLRPLESGLAVQRFIAQQEPKRGVILGGGYIGVEMAETLRRLGLDVTMIVRSGQVLRSTLDADVRELVHAELEHNRVDVVRSTPVAFEGEGRLQAVVTADGRYPCQVAILGLGVQPRVELAQAAGVRLGPTGAIATDSQMRTNLPGVYAAGDCTEVLHLVSGEPAYIPLGNTANKQGRTAGSNVAGGDEVFAGVVGTMVVRCFDLAVASTGVTTAEAEAAGHTVRATMIRDNDIAGYFPGVADMNVKLVADAATDRLLGGQIVGPQVVAKRVDVLATALHNRMTVDDLRHLDLSYAPPFAPVWDPILVAANVASR
jgi:NADPH-dependent 2,4-dienoyl-CoA reductase/sulfur reductase-like enzyme